jgi:hypothetical protein
VRVRAARAARELAGASRIKIQCRNGITIHFDSWTGRDAYLLKDYPTAAIWKIDVWGRHFLIGVDGVAANG